MLVAAGNGSTAGAAPDFQRDTPPRAGLPCSEKEDCGAGFSFIGLPFFLFPPEPGSRASSRTYSRDRAFACPKSLHHRLIEPKCAVNCAPGRRSPASARMLRRELPAPAL